MGYRHREFVCTTRSASLSNSFLRGSSLGSWTRTGGQTFEAKFGSGSVFFERMAVALWPVHKERLPAKSSIPFESKEPIRVDCEGSGCGHSE